MVGSCACDSHISLVGFSKGRMAGKRQHYIRQFLLDGFATQGKGAGSFLWIYRKEAPPFKTNVINTAVEQHFYSETDGTTADDYLTAIEDGPVGGVAQSLRACGAGVVSNPLLPELLSHLEPRTRHLRRSVLAAGETFLSRIIASIADDGWYLDGLERELLGDSPVLRAAIAEELKKLGVPLMHLEAVMAKAKPMLPTLMPGARAQLSALARHLQSQLPALLAKSAKSGHIAMLKKASAQASRIERYVDLHYTLSIAKTQTSWATP